MEILPKNMIIIALISFCYVFTEATSTDANRYDGCYAHLCNTTSNYPYEQIKEAIEKYPEYHIYFGTVLSLPRNRYRREMSRDENRVVCKEQVVTMLPQAGVDVTKKLVTIINTDELKQEVQYTICESPECGQKFKLIELVVLDEENGFGKTRVSVPFGCRSLPLKDGASQKSNEV